MHLSRRLLLAASVITTLLTPVTAFSQTQSSSPPAATSASDSQYHLGPGDKVRIITYGESSLTGEFDVTGAGVISLPLIGDITAGGLTVSALQTAIETALKNGYLLNPRVSVEVLTFRPYFILGEVMKPGQYPYSDGLTVKNAAAVAGGFTYRANQDHVFIRHSGQSAETEVPLADSTPVEPGDTIRIAERFF